MGGGWRCPGLGSSNSRERTGHFPAALGCTAAEGAGGAGTSAAGWWCWWCCSSTTRGYTEARARASTGAHTPRGDWVGVGCKISGLRSAG